MKKLLLCVGLFVFCVAATPPILRNIATTNTPADLTTAIKAITVTNAAFAGYATNAGTAVTAGTATNLVGGFTGNMLVLTNGTDTATLHITNGVIVSISAP